MDTYKVVELSKEQKELIRATIPILESSGVDLTSAFYKRMLDRNPEVRPYFNAAHQITKAQPKILAFSLLQYAKNIDDLTPLLSFVEQIVVKHVGLQVQPEQYEIVGSNLLATMSELLGEEVATPQLLEAWGVAYGNLAKILIDAEHALYEKNKWQGFKQFEVTRIESETDDIKSIYLKPLEGEIQIPKRGQYIGIRFSIPDANGQELETTREYSLSEFPTDNEYRISVKRDRNGGKISNFVQDHLKVGQILKVSPPCGKFTYQENTNDKPLLVLTAGVGITPLISIVEEALNKKRKVLMYYSNDNTRPFAKWFREMKNEFSEQFTVKEFISNPHTKAEKIDELVVGRRLNADEIPDTKLYDTYLLGPLSYMDMVFQELEKRGVQRSEIMTEFFGVYRP